MAVSHDIGRTERAEMYLKAVLFIGHEDPPVTVTKVANFLGVSAPAASEMLKRMHNQDLVYQGPDGIGLTPTGMHEARKLIRRMRLAERMLHDWLGIPLPEIYPEACRLEHALSDQVVDRLAEALGQPDTCPHGLPIPTVEGRVNCPFTQSATEVKPGERATVVSVPEYDSELLQYLDEVSVRPGVDFVVEDVAPYNGPIFLRINGETRAVARHALEQVRTVVHD